MVGAVVVADDSIFHTVAVFLMVPCFARAVMKVVVAVASGNGVTVIGANVVTALVGFLHDTTIAVFDVSVIAVAVVKGIVAVAVGTA